jgi:hypothetical protein
VPVNNAALAEGELRIKLHLLEKISNIITAHEKTNSAKFLNVI